MFDVFSGDRYMYNFAPSPKKISSYLVAFIVSDFSGTVPAKFHGDREFRTWGRST